MAKPNEVVISEPYRSYDESKSLIISASSTIKDTSGSIIGVIGIDISLEYLSMIISNIKMGDTGYAFLYSRDGTILAHHNSELNFKKIHLLNKETYKDTKTDEALCYDIKDYNKLLNESNAEFETVINGNAVLVNVYSFPETGWQLDLM